jgi:hypothetical protein
MSLTHLRRHGRLPPSSYGLSDAPRDTSFRIDSPAWIQAYASFAGSARIIYPAVMAPKAEGPTPEEEAAAEREWKRATTFDRDNQFWIEMFADHVAKGKPTLDFVAMLGVIAIAMTVFLLTASEMFRDGWSDRRALIALTAATIFGHLIERVSLATCAQIARVYLRILYRIGAPHPNEWDSQTLRALWRALIAVSGIAVLTAIGAMGWEFTRAARLIGDRPAVTQSAKSATPATEAPLSPTDDRHVAP